MIQRALGDVGAGARLGGDGRLVGVRGNLDVNGGGGGFQLIFDVDGLLLVQLGGQGGAGGGGRHLEVLEMRALLMRGQRFVRSELEVAESALDVGGGAGDSGSAFAEMGLDAGEGEERELTVLIDAGGAAALRQLGLPMLVQDRLRVLVLMSRRGHHGRRGHHAHDGAPRRAQGGVKHDEMSQSTHKQKSLEIRF